MKTTGNNLSVRSFGQYFICSSEGLPQPHRGVKKKKRMLPEDMLLSHSGTNIATQPNYLFFTKTSLICYSQKDGQDFKRLGQVGKHFSFIFLLLLSSHLLQQAFF